jgi:hypothetical protein
MGDAWSVTEVELIVADYLDMLEAELAGEQYSKTAHRRRLIGKLNHRTEGSIERKHQNISAVLREAGVPFVDGYKPLGNYQKNILPEVVHQQLASRPTLRAACERSAEQFAEVPSVEEILAMLVPTPESPVRDRSESLYERPIERPLRTYDYLQREAANASLGAAGEQLVLRFEKARLITAVLYLTLPSYPLFF